MRNWIIPSIALILSTLSLVTLKSVAPYLLVRQTTFFVIGFVIFFLVSKINTLILKKLSMPSYVVLNIVLILLIVVGKTTRGITGWINFGSGLRFQPSQLAIPIVSVFVLSQLKKSAGKITSLQKISFKNFFFLVSLIIFPGFLIVAQPDFGTAFVYFASLATLFLYPRISGKYFSGLIMLSLVMAAMGWNFVLQPYQKSRIISFISGVEQESDANYNARQSLIAVGSGQFLGRGLGQGVQSHLRFLPERQTDFIFASLAEEWGLIGSAVVILLYLLLVLFIIRNSFKFDNISELFYSLVLAVMISVQAGVNIGMNEGVLPITGITLPLLSYGGSSILAVFVMLGIHQGCLLRYERTKKLRFS